MYSGNNPLKTKFLATMGAELRSLREATDNGTGHPMSLGAVARVLNEMTGSRDRISKIERGYSGIDFFDYLRLMWLYRDVAPQDHPGVALARQLLPPESRGAQARPSDGVTEDGGRLACRRSPPDGWT